jgi:hypothetical protein
MICYRDMTFCSHGNGCKCLTEKVIEEAKLWWGKEGAPISYADLCKGVESV